MGRDAATSATPDEKGLEDGAEPRSPNPDAEAAVPPAAAASKPEFKEGGYGWVVVAAVFFLNAHTWGLNSSYAVFLAYYLRTDSFEGASPIGFAFVGGLSISISMLVSPLGTFLAGNKSFGTRKTVALGSLFVSVSFIGSSWTYALWHLVLSQGICFGIGMGLIFVASVPLSAQWFTKNRSLANATAAAGSGFGGLTYSLATNSMIDTIGLPWTFRTLGIICFVVNGVCAYLVRDRNEAVGSIHLAFNWKLFKSPSYLLMEMWLIFSVLGYIILVFSIADYCKAVGLTASQGSLISALFNLSQGIGRPLIGLGSDYFGRLNTAMFCTLFCSISCYFIWIFAARSLAACIVFALITGAPSGVMWATVAPVCAEVVGLPLIPSALSMTWLVLVLPSTFAEVIGLSLREAGTWGYLNVQAYTASMYFGGFLALWGLRAWKFQELEMAHLNKQDREAAIRDDGVVEADQSPAPLDDERRREERRNAYLRGAYTVAKV